MKSMETQHAVSTPRSGAASFSNHGETGPLSSLFPVHHTDLEKKHPEVLNSQQSLSDGTVGHIFSSSSGMSSQLHFSSVSHDDICLKKAPFITHSSGVLRSTAFRQYLKENDSSSWCTDSMSDFLSYPENNPGQSSNVQHTDIGECIMQHEDIGKRNDWQDWADQLITDDATPNWNEILVDTNVVDLEPKMGLHLGGSSTKLQVKKQMPASPGETCIPMTPPSSCGSGTQSKPRMRWRLELHEAFVEAVNKLGGSEKATPKGVLKLMKVENLSIYHVKSHLQKYRTTRFKPEPSSEGPQEKRLTPIQDLSSFDLKTSSEITETLRLQVEIQKRLHEQLETQRNLQMRIEEQGRQLQMIFEKQFKFAGDPDKPSSPITEKPEPEVINETSSSLTTRCDVAKSGLSVEGSSNVAEEQQAEVGPSESQPLKRAKLKEP